MRQTEPEARYVKLGTRVCVLTSHEYNIHSIACTKRQRAARPCSWHHLASSLDIWGRPESKLTHKSLSTLQSRYRFPLNIRRWSMLRRRNADSEPRLQQLLLAYAETERRAGGARHSPSLALSSRHRRRPKQTSAYQSVGPQAMASTSGRMIAQHPRGAEPLRREAAARRREKRGTNHRARHALAGPLRWGSTARLREERETGRSRHGRRASASSARAGNWAGLGEPRAPCTPSRRRPQTFESCSASGLCSAGAPTVFHDCVPFLATTRAVSRRCWQDRGRSYRADARASLGIRSSES